ncbi:MAG: GNAT family N-acetyltransferase [Spirochaetales bacterium]|nr:GNAT family N-acetyltransferase [Spirochaetales bacterium]
MHLVSIRENPEYAQPAVKYFQDKWANPNTMDVYDDSILNAPESASPLPQWYLLMNDQGIQGCAGLITNDFISRMDYYPWLCALYVEENQRGHFYSRLLVERAEVDALHGGFSHLYLCSNHVGFYERMGFSRIGHGFHPWGDQSPIFAKELGKPSHQI